MMAPIQFDPDGRARRDGIAASRVQLPPGSWASLLEAMCSLFPRVGEPAWVERFAQGLVLDAQGRALAALAPARVGMVVQYFRDVPGEVAIAGQEAIVHADAHLVVACKPHLLPVAPTGAWVRETLLTRLVARLDNPELAPLHRIDRDTAGLVMFSARRDSRARYQALFPERRIAKHYLAVAPPLPDLAFPHVHRSRLERGEPFFRMQQVAGAANSETRIEVVARGARWWSYRLEPVTGRKHQLRVHMAALGAPIRNDRTYPRLRDVADDAGAPLQLFAHTLAFTDPLTGQPRSFRMPEAFAAPLVD